jgi:hypothetical protein
LIHHSTGISTNTVVPWTNSEHTVRLPPRAAPALPDLLAHRDFDILLVDTADRLACKKKDLDFLMARLDKCGVTCVATTWTWDYLAQYMRHCYGRHSYRTKGCKVYAQLDAEA